MLIVEGWVKLGKGEFDKVQEAGSAMVAATLREEGCLHYSFSRDIDDPDTLRISERWVDQAALDTHFATPHMAAFNAAIGSVAREGGDVRIYGAEELRRII